MKRIIYILFFVLSAIAFLSAIWIVIPAPSSYLWLFAVAASEWSLWIAALALASFIPNIYILVTRQSGKLTVASLILAGLALIVSLYPLASSLAAARANDVTLSPLRYFAAINRLGSPNYPINQSTYTYATVDGQALKLDVYLPTRVSPNNGASVIVVHGGSWSGGVRSDFPQWNNRLAEMGFTIFDIDYRLEQPNYLTATGDVKCAVGWVQQHAIEFKIDSERIALMGRSAGAQLALLAAYSSDDKRLPSSCPEITASGNVRAVISLYGPTDLLWAYDNPANQMVIDGPQTLSNFLGGNPHSSDEIRDRYILASPISHINAATPPTLIIHGAHDQLVRPENLQLLDQKLNAANIPHRTVILPYAQHGFDYNINGWGSQIMERVMLDFIKEHTK